MSKLPTILIVEDDPVFRRVLSFTIAKSGLNVETANHGGLGFDRLMQGGIDFLVTDLQMPICSGLELLERLDAAPGYSRPGTILCTAKGMELDSEAIIKQYRLAEIMHKPFSPRKLGEAIQRYLSPTGGTSVDAAGDALGRAPLLTVTQTPLMSPHSHA